MLSSRNFVRTAFTLIELIVMIAVVVLIVAVLVSSMRKVREQTRQIDCLNNLKQVGLASRLWIGNGDRFAMAVSTNQGGTLEVSDEVWRTFFVMSNELQTPGILVCQSDNRVAAKSWSSLANSSISYFVCLDGEETAPDVLLAGDRNITNGEPPLNKILTLSSSAAPGWTEAIHGSCGNVVLVDGSARRYDQTGLVHQVSRALADLESQRKHMTNPPPLTLRLAIPE